MLRLTCAVLLSFLLGCHYICGDNFCGVVYIAFAGEPKPLSNASI